MMANIEDIIMEAGLSGSLWEFDMTDISKYISKHSWMHSTIEYNFDNDIILNIPHGQLRGKRMNDKSIMQCALEIYSNIIIFRGSSSVQ